jgi:hypothetical protein
MNKYVVLSAIFSGLITWVFMYLDAKLFDTPKSKFTYFKGILYVSGLVATIVYLMVLGINPATVAQGTGPFLGQTTVPLALAQMGGTPEMLTGMPPF